MGFARLRPFCLIELLRTAFRNRQGAPVIAREMAGKLHNLSDVVTTVPKRARQRQRHRMRFAPNRHRMIEVGGRQTAESLKQAIPATFPVVNNLRPTAQAVDKLAITVSPRLLAIAR